MFSRSGYYHQLFLRGRRDLSRNIQRQQVKGTGVRQVTQPEQEPNFYLMDIMPPSCNNATKAPDTSIASMDTAPASQLGTILPSALPYFHQPSNIQQLNVVSVPLSETQYSNMASIRSQLQQHSSPLNVSSFPSEYLRSWLERHHVASHNPTLAASDFHACLATWPRLEQSHEHVPASSQPNMESDNCDVTQFYNDNFDVDLNLEGTTSTLLPVPENPDQNTHFQQESDEVFDAVLRVLRG